ncbi:hypothetical protein ACHHYP_16855 [Achlya hypogyna]|uniref:Transmembrane protein n=1 Tax=Achlya hypogyna TaxID=1202772 RepID=A0A1V9Y5L3_ACHHY|nr:hypothetical protein ACHHYP_16855 [Achlya hypogyna]
MNVHLGCNEIPSAGSSINQGHKSHRFERVGFITSSTRMRKIQVGPLGSPRRPSLVAEPPRRAARLWELTGVAYIVASVALGFVSLDCFSYALATDLFVPDYQEVSEVLIQVLNNGLSVLADKPLLLDPTEPSLTVLADIGTVAPAYPRLIMYQEQTSLNSAVVGLRNLAPFYVVLMVSPYCWVDLERRYEMAYTIRRQARCRQSETTNAAVHFETVLRNIDFALWRESVQGKFDSCFGDPIASTGLAGEAWVHKLVAHTWISVAEEIALWESHGFTSFTLQYGTGVAIGLQETIAFENALGMWYNVPIKSLPQENLMPFRTTMIAYNLLFNDLYAIGANQSLVRNTSMHFANFNSDIIEEFVAEYPLSIIGLTVHDNIGPLGSIDTKWVQVPPDLVAAVVRFQRQVATLIATNASAREYYNTALISIDVRPALWSDASLLFLGGNPLCLYNSPRSYVQQTFSFSDVCSREAPLTVDWVGLNGLFAVAMLRGAVDHAVCTQGRTAIDARACYAAVTAATSAYASLDVTVPVLPTSVGALNLGFLQLILRNDTVKIESLPLLTPSWALFGWMALYDWAVNAREALSLEGDVQTFNMLSALYPSVPATTAKPPVSLSSYLWNLTVVASLLLASAGAFTLLFWLASRPVGSAWFAFSPVAASVWVGRNLTLARGVAAIACLATAPLASQKFGRATRLALVPRSFITSCLLASESLWVVYVLHDAMLPLTGHVFRRWAPWTTLLAYFVIVALDVAAPVTITATLDRHCYTVNMDHALYCESGTVRVGSWTRSIQQITILGASVAVVVAAAAVNRRGERAFPNEVVPPIYLALAFPAQHAVANVSLENAVAAMCGIFRFGGIMFDMKLWRVLVERVVLDPSKRSSFVGTLWTAISNPLPSMPSTVRLPHRHRAVVGIHLASAIGYLVATIMGNFAYLTALQLSMTNDFGWATFNTSGMHAFLANTLNERLLWSSPGPTPLQLDEPASGDVLTIYGSDSMGAVALYPTTARRQLLDPNTTTLRSAVIGLRATNPCMLPWMFTQYCWLDFDQRWEMANSAARQTRCAAAYRANGAVYLEAGLRNLRDWDDWTDCWGASFDIGIAAHLSTTIAGAQWLNEVRVNGLSVADEVAFWQKAGIESFVLQWQNFKTTGLSDRFVIMNAWGLSYPLTLSKIAGNMRVGRQTSLRMYWAPASDMWAVATNATSIGGASLLRSSPQFAFMNVSAISLLIENGTVLTPLTPGTSVFVDFLGPFGSVDTMYVPPPASLRQFYGAARAALANLTLTDKKAQTSFYAVPLKAYIGPVPTAVLRNTTLQLVGGSVLCGDDLRPFTPKLGVPLPFSFDGVCHWWLVDYITPPVVEILIALVGYDSGGVTPSDFAMFCANDVYAEPTCEDIYAATYAFLDAYRPAFSAATSFATTVHAILTSTLIIETHQLIINGSDTQAVDLVRQRLLDGDAPWQFISWIYLYEWITAAREVVHFRGDNRGVTLLSAIAQVQSVSLDITEIPTELSYVCQTCVKYVTLTLLTIAFVASLYVVAVGGNVEPWNLFEFNRVVGHVWIGRLLLVVRSATALWLLHTARLELVVIGAGVVLHSPPLSWFNVLLASSELTWLAYILNDLLSVVTQQYTCVYAYKSTFCVWMASITLSQLMPQTYSATLDRVCNSIDMDAALDCTSATIVLGHPSQLLRDVGVVCTCVVLTACIERWRDPTLPPKLLPTRLLSSTSYDMFDRAYWTLNATECFIDRASALLAGLISIQCGAIMYIFDIKSWRLYSHNVPLAVGGRDRFHRALALHRVE